MRLLVDTHVLLWWLRDDVRLGPRSRAMLASGGNEVLVSIATPWEVAIKYRLGKLGESGTAVMQAIDDARMTVVPIRAGHLAAVEALPRLHGDPFDHLLIAQAIVERAPIMTGDAMIPRYGVPCLGVA